MLGHLVADLGYKRVYVTSIEALVKACVWEKSRTLRPVHSAEIFKAKKLEAQRNEVRRIKDGEKPKDNLVGVPCVCVGTCCGAMVRKKRCRWQGALPSLHDDRAFVCYRF